MIINFRFHPACYFCTFISHITKFFYDLAVVAAYITSSFVIRLHHPLAGSKYVAYSAVKNAWLSVCVISGSIIIQSD